MLAAGHVPDKVAILEATHRTLLDRTTHRRIDPHTGHVYHVPAPKAKALSPPLHPVTRDGVLDPAVVARLTVRHDDSEENVRNRLWFWDLHGADLRSVYCHVAHVVYAERAPEHVYEDVRAHVLREDTWHEHVAVTRSGTLPDVQYVVATTLKLRTRQLMEVLS